MGRFGKFGVDYVPDIGGGINADSMFSVRTEMMTFNFVSNFSEWSTFTKEMKQACAKFMQETLADISLKIGTEAIKRCPHYSGAMERSIKAIVPEVSSLLARGRVTAIVGVLSSWKSTYESNFKERDFPASSSDLARYIHEYYDTFIEGTIFGKKRRDRKSAITGARVGSHFLLRAYTESDLAPLLQGFVQKMKLVGRMKSTMWSAATESAVKDVNDMLEQYANSIDAGLGAEVEEAYGRLLTAVKNR